MLKQGTTSRMQAPAQRKRNKCENFDLGIPIVRVCIR